MDINKPMTVDDEIAYNNYKLTADKILQLLSQIREDPSASAKRWVWELLQNAKDVPNRFGKVSVEIELVSQDTLKFRHNGDCFSTKNITGLVQQVSSKDSQNLEGQTGKFGTGFICSIKTFKNPYHICFLYGIRKIRYFNDTSLFFF